MLPKSGAAVMQNCIEAYECCCKPICRELKMPQMAFDILMFLASSPEHCTARDISRYRGFKETILSVNVNKLVTEGYLERREVEGDRRKVKLVCTEKARPIIERGREIQRSFTASILEGLTGEELDVFRHCLGVMGENAAGIIRGGIR